ncbi:MAG: hypothetical protein F4X35_07900 [Alphaproteobacteria bacterium]|nr:hypothetical protein [Alphaproteobacteria bacterium]
MARRRFVERDAAISRAVAAGVPVRSIAADYGLAVSTVYGITRREGWTWHLGPRQILRLCDLPGCTRQVPRASNRYCSHECFVASRRLHLPQCINCPNPVKHSSSKFCSRACYHAHMRSWWSDANGERNRRITRDALAGATQLRIASDHLVHPRTVSNVLHGFPGAPPEQCAAAGCTSRPTRKHRRFCSWACFQAWHEAQKPLCEAGCGARAHSRSGRFCSKRCHTDHLARVSAPRNA